MRIDPAAVFAHAMASAPLRAILAWVVMTIGCLAPTLIGHGWDGIENHGGVSSFTPFFLYVAALSTNCWPLSMTILVVLAWRLIAFLWGEGTSDLFWMFLLPFLICIGFSDDAWPYAALLALLASGLFYRYQRLLSET